MPWQFAGTVAVESREWSLPIPVFAQQLRLTYSSPNPTVLKVGYSGWLRIFYSDQGIYAERWDRLWPKDVPEMVSLLPWEPTLGQHAVQFRQGGRELPVDPWAVTVEYWLAPADPTDPPDAGVTNLSIGGERLTVDDIPIEF